MNIPETGGYACTEQIIDQKMAEQISEMITCGICLMILDNP